MSDIPKSVWSGSFNVFGVELKCHVLDNGQRIIEADSMAKFLDDTGVRGISDAEMNLDEFVRWFRS